MPIKSSVAANERGTIKFTCSFVDESGEAVVPTSITWTLTDKAGNVINDRTSEAVTPAASVNIVLSGDDLAIDSDTTVRRLLTVSIVYDSTLGSGLTENEEIEFPINKMVNIANIP